LYTRNSILSSLRGRFAPISWINCEHVLFVYIVKQNKKFRGFSQKISRIFKILKNLMTIEFWWRQIFEILIIDKPSLESLDVPQKIWARSVQLFWRLLDTNRQTDRQTDKPNLYIDYYSIISIYCISIFSAKRAL